MSDLVLILMIIFNNLCVFHPIFLMLCCGILLKGIPSSASNYLWHKVAFGVKSREVLGVFRSPAGLASSHVAGFSLNPLCEACQGSVTYFQGQKVYIWRLIPLSLEDIFFSSVS